MGNLMGFNARNVTRMDDFGALPAGDYVAAITKSEMKATRAGTGQYLELDFQILEGDYRGRHIWSRLNLKNPNATAVAIAESDLAAICMAVGVFTPNDSSDLHNIPLLITVKEEKRRDTDVWTTAVKGYAKCDAAPAVPQEAAPAWESDPGSPFF